jgi:hypothetical protein
VSHIISSLIFSSRIGAKLTALLEVGDMIVSRLHLAVSLMTKGFYEEAIAELDDTIKSLKTYFYTQQDELTQKDSVNESCRSPTVEAVLGPSCVACSNSRFRSSEYPIYDRAMLLHSVENQTDWTCEVNVAVVSAVALYNKGLVFHLMGQGNVETSRMEAYNARALSLYENALKLISTCSPSNEQSLCLKVALLHNSGQLYSYICDRASEQLCLAYIDKLLIHKEMRHGKIDDESELKLNVMLLLGSHRPSPAA